MSRKRETRFGYDVETDDDIVEGDENWVSRTERKNAMHELQDLGVALLELPDERLDKLDMEERLRDALTELRRLKSFEAIRRQSQFIGKLLRDADPEPFRAAIIDYRLGHSRALELAEAWRTRLLADDEALTDWMREHPRTDKPALRALIRNTRRELAQAEAAREADAASNQKRPRFRELFQFLRTSLQDAESAAS